MSARPRRLTRAVVLAATAGLLAACAPTLSRTPPAATNTPTIATSPTPSPTPKLIGTTWTVLSPLGLRIHSVPVLVSTNVIGGFAQGAKFTILEYQSGGGGWYRVQGRTVTGWVVSDPTLTAPGSFNQYAEANGVTALYPISWGFQQSGSFTFFVPQMGTQSVVVESGASLKALGPPGLAGYAQSSTGSVLVCGYTGVLGEYVKESTYSGPSPPALPVAVSRLSLYAAIRLTFDASHAMVISFNYQTPSQLDVFDDVYNSIAFPYPLCEKPPTATAAP